MKLNSKVDNYINLGLLVIRIGLGILFIYHGVPKLIGGPVKWERLGSAIGYLGIHFLPLMWGFISAVTESIGGLFILLGVVFRPACILLVINLIVAAVFTYNISGSFADSTHAIEDAITFAGLFFTGPGLYRVDKLK